MEIGLESSTQKDRFRIVANKLLNACFILKRKEDTRDDYFYIIQNQNYFVDYFDLLGYSIDVNESLGVIFDPERFWNRKTQIEKNRKHSAAHIKVVICGEEKGIEPQ